VQVMSQDGTERVLGYRPISLPGSPLYVSAGLSTGEAFAPINRATMTNSIGIAVGALVSLLLAMFIGERFLLAPISRISEVMRNWRDGKTNARTQMSPSDELHAVGATLDDLLDELDARRDQNEKAEEARELLVRELAHRVKNGFALVQAIARQTFAKAEPERYHSFSDRLAALASTYDLILSKEGAGSSMHEVVSAALRSHLSSPNRIVVNGTEVPLPSDLALPLSLVIHELATNAIKYGSLGAEDGRVLVDWNLSEGRLRLVWREVDGPPVKAPERTGFGTVLIGRAFPAKAKADSHTEYRPDGLVFEISFSVEPTAANEVSIDREEA